MGGLADWSKKGSKFISIKQGEPFTGKFEGARVVQSHFNPEKEVIAYTFDGKTLNSGSKILAYQMDAVHVGQKVVITRTGEGAKTKYDVQVIE